MNPRAAAATVEYVAPGLFVFLWATGFVGTKIGVRDAEPFTFLAIRFAIAAALMFAITAAAGARWPRWPRGFLDAAVAGVLVHGGYLGGVFWAIDRGMPAGVAALIVGIHPLLAGFLVGPALGERVSRRQWLGLLLGFGGVALVVGEEIGFAAASLLGVAACGVSVLGIALGTVWQKRQSRNEHIRANQTIQLAAAMAAMCALSLAFETGEVRWSAEFIASMAWLSVVMSVGAVTLLYWLNRRGQVSRVASLFYLVPPVAALLAHLFFGETLSALSLAGMAVAVFGVALATRAG